MDETGSSSKLLQRVYFGFNDDLSPILALTEDSLNSELVAKARRISTIHLPWSAENNTWPLSGTFDSGGTITTSISTAFDDQASNPFLHTYHPDHDNLDAEFSSTLDQGRESYAVERNLELQLDT